MWEVHSKYKNFCIYANKWRKSRHFSLVDARKRAIRLEVKGYRLEAGDYSREPRELNQMREIGSANYRKCTP